MSSQSSIQTPAKIKRKFRDTELKLDNIPFTIGRTMEGEETVINGTELEFLTAAGKFLPKLLSSSEIQILKTVPKEAVKEMLIKGALDKDMLLTDEEGAKMTFKEALMTL